MNQGGRQLVIENLIGLGLAVIAIVSFTAGTYIEVLLLGMVVSIPFMTIQVIRQPTWTWRFIFVGLLVLQVYSFYKPGVAEMFTKSKYGFILTDAQIESIGWLMPCAAGFCLASFWMVLVSTMKKNKKPIPKNTARQ